MRFRPCPLWTLANSLVSRQPLGHQVSFSVGRIRDLPPSKLAEHAFLSLGAISGTSLLRSLSSLPPSASGSLNSFRPRSIYGDAMEPYVRFRRQDSRERPAAIPSLVWGQYFACPPSRRGAKINRPRDAKTGHCPDRMGHGASRTVRLLGTGISLLLGAWVRAIAGEEQLPIAMFYMCFRSINALPLILSCPISRSAGLLFGSR